MLYKIQNDSIYATKFTTYLNPDSAAFSFLKTVDKDNLVGKLQHGFPSELLNEQTVFTVHPILDSAGYHYFEVKNGNTIKKWMFGTKEVPEYLTSYLADVQSVMNNLK